MRHSQICLLSCRLPWSLTPGMHIIFIQYSLMKKKQASPRWIFKCNDRNNIGVGVHYLSIPEHPYYQKTFGWKPEDYPHAMRIGRQSVSLPLSAKLTDGDVGDVVEAVKRIVG